MKFTRAPWLVSILGIILLLGAAGAYAQTTDLSQIQEIAAGANHTCALLANGTVWCWGYNLYGQLGNGTSGSGTDSEYPVEVLTDPSKNTPLIGAVAIAAGGASFDSSGHTCAVRADGTVWCWGRNADGQLGNGSTDSSSTPVQVSNLSNAVAIAAGGSHTCAVRADGTVWCWGRNADGQLGYKTGGFPGAYSSSTTPVEVLADPKTNAPLKNVVAIAAGDDYTCALQTTGRVWCWGGNLSGQLGDGLTNNYGFWLPVAVVAVKNGVPLSNVVAIAAGGDSAYRSSSGAGVDSGHTCALLADGKVKCWGANDNGQLGDGTTAESPVPVSVSNLTDAIAISAGPHHTCAVLASGTAKCWGANGGGQLGDDSTTEHKAPVDVKDLTGAVAITAGGGLDPYTDLGGHTCALKSDGTVMCWGLNTYGQLGDGTTNDVLTPVSTSPLF